MNSNNKSVLPAPCVIRIMVFLSILAAQFVVDDWSSEIKSSLFYFGVAFIVSFVATLGVFLLLMYELGRFFDSNARRGKWVWVRLLWIAVMAWHLIDIHMNS